MTGHFNVVIAAGAGLVVGFGATAFLLRGRTRRDAVTILSGMQYSQAFRACRRRRAFTVIKVFGYTGETVLNDLLQFDDRYDPTLEVRLLHRSWIAEAKDETAFNAQPRSNPRSWDKAGAIRTTGTAHWVHAMKRFIRYYDGPPCIKGVILCAPGSERREAFLTFYEWVDEPSSGGSQFKASGMAILHLTDKDEKQRDLIRYLDSQFELQWRRGKTATEVIALEAKNAAAIQSDKSN